MMYGIVHFYEVIKKLTNIITNFKYTIDNKIKYKTPKRMTSIKHSEWEEEFSDFALRAESLMPRVKVPHGKQT